MKYLGITINKCLSQTKHIEERYGRCVYLLQRLKQDWGLNSEKICWIHTAIVQPKWWKYISNLPCRVGELATKAWMTSLKSVVPRAWNGCGDLGKLWMARGYGIGSVSIGPGSVSTTGNQVNLLTQAISGPVPLRGHIQKWKDRVNPLCTLCNEATEHPHYRWVECPFQTSDCWFVSEAWRQPEACIAAAAMEEGLRRH